ncbi:nephronectin [Acipenser oxyrinchus oxyrinchus]|uniref:Nephronectin n=1 Tax=Acipenser oxyrinchus oxyrinchus TaxID=40147 RepID=A0AAD8GKU2_ACIOX|nr:nephronectin [Acipenser oxyrinchus oxyrinchus]
MLPQGLGLLSLFPLLLLMPLLVADDNRKRLSKAVSRLQSKQPSVAVCTYGQFVSCCYGWKNFNGVCQPQCKKSCRNGICIGPNKCSCYKGFQGKYCEADVNECGLLPRLCSHSCMNTQGSYRCYCQSGFQLNADGETCSKTSPCSNSRCQFGCQDQEEGGMRCVCPSGLRLALDNRTCEDIDECQHGADICPSSRSCRNTFGSYLCVCREGFVIGMLQGKMKCRDKDECLLGTHRCSRHGHCINTLGSYMCKCQEQFSGDGFTCQKQKINQSLSSSYYRYKLSKRKISTKDFSSES